MNGAVNVAKLEYKLLFCWRRDWCWYFVFDCPVNERGSVNAAYAAGITYESCAFSTLHERAS
jgi:hypothetical protein